MNPNENPSLIYVFLFFVFILSLSSANAQVKNQVIKPEQASRYGVAARRQANISSYRLANLDVKKLLKEDSIERLQGKPFRFGKAVDVDVDLITSSTKSINSDTTLYVYQIESKGAYSLNLIFDQFVLAKNASLLIYSTDKTMVYGPVTSDNNPPNRIFWTDLLKGESIIVQISVLGEDTSETKIKLDKVIHGYQNVFAGYGQSANCNRNIACPEGNTWRNDGNSVAMLLLANGQRFCSGVLLNNACQDFTPNLLTAFHCLDMDVSGALSAAEQSSVNNWVFRFLYESPTCTPGSDGTTFQSINGSSFRAASQASDFALLLLNSRPTGNVTLAGWSRANVAATSAAAIHHPNGDVKKISIDNNALTNVNVTTNWGAGLTCPPNTHWQSIFETGTVQPGSSGSPIFDQNHRVVGQLHGDYLNNNNDFCANRRGHYGRFDVSWTGGGTATTRLSTWLTNDPNVMNVNTLAIPRIVAAAGTGYPVVCSNSAGFNLVNAPSSATHNVVWTVTPNLTIISQGSASVLVRYSGTQNGTGTITANISSTNTGFCSGSTAFSINVQAGPFNSGQVSVSGQAAVCPGNSYTYTANVPGGHQGYTYQWTFPSGWSVFSQYLNTITLYVPQYNTQYGTVMASVNNGCGVSGFSGITVFPGYSCGSYFYSYFPNPAEDELTVEAYNAFDGSSLQNEEQVDFDVSIYDSQQNILLQTSSNLNKAVISVRDLKKGVYILQIVDDKHIVRERIAIK